MSRMRTKLRSVRDSVKLPVSKRGRLAALIAGAVIIIGGGAGGFVVVHPPSGGTCYFSRTDPNAAAGCTAASAGIDLEITNNAAHADNTTNYVDCKTNLISYANSYARGTNGVNYTRTTTTGTWPIKISINFAVGTTDPTHNQFDFGTGCTGDGDPTTVDLFLCTQGNGQDTGGGNDVVKVGNITSPAGGIQIVSNPSVCTNVQGRTGGINDGPKYCGLDGFCGGNPSCPTINNTPPNNCGGDDAHQDCIQIQGNADIQWEDSVEGDYGHHRATCAGSGGALWINAVAPSSYCVNGGNGGCMWIRGHSIACNHGLNAKITTQNGVVSAGNSVGRVENSVWRVGAPGVVGDDGWFVCSTAAASNNLTTEAPGWTFTNNTTETYCASGAQSYCVNNGGSGYPTANNMF